MKHAIIILFCIKSWLWLSLLLCYQYYENIDKITSQYSWIRTIGNHIKKWFLFDSFVFLFHHSSLFLFTILNLFPCSSIKVNKIIITHLFYSVQSIHHTFHFIFVKNSLLLYSWIQHHLTIQSLPLTQTQYL